MKYLPIFLAIAFFALAGAGCATTTQNANVNGTVTNTASAVTLDLSNQGLTKIPNDVFNKTQLQELNVSNNQIEGAIQSQIGQLGKLRILDASDNLMTGVPAEIGKLSNLTMLDLSNNKLTGLPNELGNLKKLEILDLSGNNVSQMDLDGIKKNLPATTTVITN